MNRLNSRYRADNVITFCSQPWGRMVLGLAAAVLATFFWAFFLLGYSLDEFEVDDYAIRHFPPLQQSMGGIQQVATGNPVVLQQLESMKTVVAPAIAHIHSDLTPVTDQGVPMVLASGVLIHPSGYLVTTAHALANRQPLMVDIKTSTGIKRYEAELIKTALNYDLALLKLKTTDRFLFLRLADLTTIRPADPLFAYGLGMKSAVIGAQGSVQRSGVTLQVGQQSMSQLLQSDAIYTWEQSGGALVNSHAQLVGINLAVTDSTGAVSGYAIPATMITIAFPEAVPAPPKKVAGVPQTDPVTPWPIMGLNIAATPTAPATAAAPPPRPTAHLGVVDSEHQAGFSIAGHTLASVLGLGILGLIAGVVGGMVTMGGGIILVTGMLVFFGYGMMLIRPVAFLTNVFTYGAASLKNSAAGLVMWDQVKRLAPWGIVGVLIGFLLGTELDDRVVGYLLGIFALLIAAKTLHEVTMNPDEEVEAIYYSRVKPQLASEPDPFDGAVDLLADRAAETDSALTSSATLRHALLGLPMGLVSGILGISGGVIEVPLQRYYAKIALHNAIANSAVMVFWASLTASIVSLAYGNKIGAFEWETPFVIALIMVPTSYVGGMIGARLLGYISPEKLKWLFSSLMLVVGIKMLFGQ